MDVPPVQYVTTSDGVNIAYSVCGQGPPLVFLPVIFSHLQLDWRSPARQAWFEGLASRFRLVVLDIRGQGMSGRGLPADHSMADWVHDLEAVVERQQLRHFVLLGGGSGGHIAARYAETHPELVGALILSCCAIASTAWPMSFYQELAHQNWDGFIQSVGPRLTGKDVHGATAHLKEAMHQRDYEIGIQVFASSNLSDALRELSMPTLVLHPCDFSLLDSEESMRLAGRIPNARMALTEGDSIFGDPTSVIPIIEEFLRGLPGEERPVPDDLGGVTRDLLSGREVEVLRLIAAGMSNQQIADELVISVRTVERHINHIYAKIGTHTKAQATAYALRHRLN